MNRKHDDIIVIPSIGDPRNTLTSIAMFQNEYGEQWNLMMAGACVSIIPTVVLFFCAQKYFVQGIVTTGIKD